MNILGISGLANSVSFKEGEWPGLAQSEYHISQGHDSAAALVVDGKIVAAAAQERFSRHKHTGAFPVDAIRYCLAAAGIQMEAVDELAHGFDYEPYREMYSLDPSSSKLFREVLSRDALLAEVRGNFPELAPERVHSVGHHLAHGASAAFTSGWDECLVIVNDAMGEAQSVSVYRFSSNRLEKLFETSANHSIGIVYSLVTLHLGFDFNADEYKVMGLAPYGDASRYRSFFQQEVQLRSDGSIRIPMLQLNRSREERENYLGTRAYLEANLIPRRNPEDAITREHEDVAAALQECLNSVVLHIGEHFGKLTGLRRLALAGGVSLNCTANSKLADSGLFDEVYIQPAAGDDGTALGAALYRASRHGEVVNERMPAPFLGPSFEKCEIDKALKGFSGRVRVRNFESLQTAAAEAAALIANGKVIAWFRGRMEYGPRALGNRSILADPGRREMRDRINSMVKMREGFRPFAPACTEEEAHRWFDVAPATSLPYMITTVRVREQHRESLPAVTHVDGTARLQTVSAKNSLEFHTLLRAVGVEMGREMLLNTSFNVKGQPIVRTPAEAIETFLSTGIDALFLENQLVTRPGVESD